MRTHPILLAVSIMLCGSLAWAAGEKTQQQSQAEYSADSYTENAEMTLKEKVYAAPGKLRKEPAMGDSTPVTIIRMDKGVMWTLMPDDKMAMEMSMQQAQSKSPGVDMSGYQMEKTEVGREVVNGHEAIKYKMIMTGPKGNKLGGFQWVVSPGIQIKMDAVSKDGDSKERIKMELTNLKIGKQDPALFEIPDGYTKMTMPSIPGMGNRGMKGLLEGMPKGLGQESE
jgi:outer membrane lipoprotein-sorting protein